MLGVMLSKCFCLISSATYISLLNKCLSIRESRIGNWYQEPTSKYVLHRLTYWLHHRLYSTRCPIQSGCGLFQLPAPSQPVFTLLSLHGMPLPHLSLWNPICHLVIFPPTSFSERLQGSVFFRPGILDTQQAICLFKYFFWNQTLTLTNDSFQLFLALSTVLHTMFTLFFVLLRNN